MSSKSLRAVVVLAATLHGTVPAEPHRVTVDFAIPAGELRPLHGINKGPLAANGLIDVSEAQKALRIPYTRLHDCQHPNPAVVDIHTVFPNFDADPALPDSYDFRATDEYLAAVRTTGAEMIYRLGESIEHQTVKRHVHPPRDPAKWAAICTGIVRHYNGGWANGFHYGIRYWEIWNEPENRPAMWTGSDARFLELYLVTARALRMEFPALLIGGPGFGSFGKFDGTELQPSPFCAAFLKQCRLQSLPLDFFSWHCYTDNPAELASRSGAVRRMLDAAGFQKTESHLNEWNYLPGNSWDVLSRTAAPEVRQRAVEQMAGAPGAAFLAAALIDLQDAPVDVCNFFHGETGIFGLFTEVGAPTRTHDAMLAFAKMLDTPKRVRVTGAIAGKFAIAACTDVGKTRAALLVANLTGPDHFRISLTNFPWEKETNVSVHMIDGTRALEAQPGITLTEETLNLQLTPPAVALITLRPKVAAFWKRHVIDDSSKGADGVRMADVNGDGLMDIATGWEQGGTVRACLNPGPAKAREPWPAVTLGNVTDVEDAVFADIDGDGAVDVVSCAEGDTRVVSIHWAPKEHERFAHANAWRVEALPVSAGAMMWMFASPMRIGGKLALVAGGKGRDATIGWFELPADARKVADWKWHALRPVGWTMSLAGADMDGDGDEDIVFSDRKGERSGAYWLENPDMMPAAEWREHIIGGAGIEAMFLHLADLDRDGLEDVLLAVRPKQIHWLRRLDRTGLTWKSHIIPLPEPTGGAKAITAGDIDGDGGLDLVFSCEGATTPRHGLMWLKCEGAFDTGKWSAHPLGGVDGVKHDLVELIDLDADGDLDAITTEEVKNLGVIWYENPAKR